MSRYLKRLLADNDSDDGERVGRRVVVKKVPHYLQGIQTDAPVTNDTSELYEEIVEDTGPKTSKKCFECGKRGHLSKFCPTTKKGSGLRHANPRSGDWTCASCLNVNWNWRDECNRCGIKRPMAGESERRTGRGGGFNEIDEETRERMARKRQQREEELAKVRKANANSEALSAPISTEVSQLACVFATGLKLNETEKQLVSQSTFSGDVLRGVGAPLLTDLKSELAHFFGQIGLIVTANGSKQLVICTGDFGAELFESSDTVASDSSAMHCSALLQFADSQTADAAIDWFHNALFRGAQIAVFRLQSETHLQLAVDCGFVDSDTANGSADDSSEDELELEAQLLGFSRELNAVRGGGRGRGHSRGSGRRTAARRRSSEEPEDGGDDSDKDCGERRTGGRRRGRGFAADDWKCDGCTKLNWAQSEECYRCGDRKPDYVRELQRKMRAERRRRAAESAPHSDARIQNEEAPAKRREDDGRRHSRRRGSEERSRRRHGSRSRSKSRSRSRTRRRKSSRN